MRQSNYLFTKGSIVFVRFNKDHYYSYLNGRPLIVVSNPSHIMNTLIVCTTGTQDKPGIEVSFWNHFANQHVGGVEVSKIYPYSMMTIHSDQIISTIGQLDPFIMRELDKAIDFHLGRSTEVPGYLLNIEAELTSVTHNTIDLKHVRADSISAEYRSAIPYKKEVVREHKEEDLGVDDRADIEEAVEDEVPEYNFSEIYNDPSELIAAIDEESVNAIVSRTMSIHAMCRKYNLGKYQAKVMRENITKFVCDFARNLLDNIPEVRSLRTENLADYAFIGMALLWAFSTSSEYDFTKYESEIEEVIEKYNIDTDNKRIWRSAQMFN